MEMLIELYSPSIRVDELDIDELIEKFVQAEWKEQRIIDLLSLAVNKGMGAGEDAG